MSELWNKFTAWLSGRPDGTKEDEELFKREEIIEQQVKESKARKAKKPKGLNSKKKKKARKQGNIG